MFYKNLTVYEGFGGIVLAEEEGLRLAEALGQNHLNLILQNHGYVFFPYGFWFLLMHNFLLIPSLGKTSHLRLDRRRSCGLLHRVGAGLS